MSLFSWAAFIICSVGLTSHFAVSGDTQVLAFGIPGLMLLLAIPMALNWMSRRSYGQAEGRFRKKASLCRIDKINSGMSGSIVRVEGDVEKVMFRWLKRPHYSINDKSGNIKVIMFTSPAEVVKAGDKVDVLGIVMKGIFNRKKPSISAVGIRKLQ